MPPLFFILLSAFYSMLNVPFNHFMMLHSHPHVFDTSSAVLWLICDVTSPLCCIATAVMPFVLSDIHTIFILGPILLHAITMLVTVYVDHIAKRPIVNLHQQQSRNPYNPIDNDSDDDSGWSEDYA